jgi:hypothetical protein
MGRIAITAEEAYGIMDILGLRRREDRVVYYATNEARTDVYEFNSEESRNLACKNTANRQSKNRRNLK